MASCALSAAARRPQVHGNGPQLDDELLADEEVQAAIRDEGSVHRKLAIANTDRTALGRVGGAIARLHGDSGFAGTVSLELEARGPRSGPGRARGLLQWLSLVCVPGLRAGSNNYFASRPCSSMVSTVARGLPDHASGWRDEKLCCVAGLISLPRARRAARGSPSRRSSWPA
jgi:hypothetical protein